MSLGQNIRDFFSASTALGRTAFGASKGRLSTLRFAEKKDKENHGALHWLEAAKYDATYYAAADDAPLYQIYQCRRNFGNAPQKPKQQNGRVTITIDGEKLFTFSQTLEILKSWEDEATANPDLVIPSVKQPLRSLHYSRHHRIG